MILLTTLAVLHQQVLVLVTSTAPQNYPNRMQSALMCGDSQRFGFDDVAGGIQFVSGKQLSTDRFNSGNKFAWRLASYSLAKCRAHVLFLGQR